MKFSVGHVAWTESYRIGVPTIDAEHKNLFIAVNTYVDAVMCGEGLKYCGAILDTLTDYAGTHFEREEQLMQAAGYHGFAAHRACHASFLEALGDFRKLLAEGFDIGNDVSHFLTNWLSLHVIELDGEMGAFIRAPDQSKAAAA